MKKTRILTYLMIKDTYQVSGNAHHEFARVSKQIPRHFHLKHRIAEFNSLWPTPDGSGVQQSLEDHFRDINFPGQKNI